MSNLTHDDFIKLAAYITWQADRWVEFELDQSWDLEGAGK